MIAHPEIQTLYFPGHPVANARLDKAFETGAKVAARRSARQWMTALTLIGLLTLIFVEAGHAQQTLPAFNTPQMNSDYFVGQLGQSTIQATVSLACSKGVGARVVIPTGSQPTDTITSATGCASVFLEDRRTAPPQSCTWGTGSYVCSAAAQGATGTNGGAALGMDPTGAIGADPSITESWYADMSCNVPPGSTAGTAASLPPGWDIGSNQACLQGFVAPATTGTLMFLGRNLQFSGGTQPAIGQFTVSARMVYQAGANTGSSVGFNSAAAKTQNTVAAKHILAVINSSGFSIDNGGVVTNVLPVAGTSSGTAGTTDSGFGGGWAAPPSGTYDVTLTYPGDGTLILSLMLLGTPGNSYSFRLANQTLPGTLTNLEVNGFNSTYDRIGNVSYSIGGPRSTSYNVPHRNGYYGGAILWRYPAAGNVWAWLPANYDRHGNNRWVVAFHGYNETGNMVQQQYLPATNYLLQQGYVIVSLDNTLQNCYGNAQCMTDVATALQTARSSLSLAPQPYVMCDSMGCFAELNAVSQGSIQPKAGVLFCGNTNLLWDYQSGGAAAAITTAYAITGGNPYLTATAGFDPQVSTGSSLARLSAVPWLLFSSPSDTTVLKTVNTDLFAAKILAAGGSATVVATTGPHEDPSNFQGPAVTNFFNTH